MLQLDIKYIATDNNDNNDQRQNSSGSDFVNVSPPNGESPVHIEQISSQPTRYYIEKGPMGQPSDVKEFKPLSMHPDPTESSEPNSENKYFIRIATSSKSAEHTWIKVWNPMEPTPIQYWSFPESQLNIQPLLASSGHIDIKLKTDPTKAFILPPERKIEFILDPETYTLRLKILDPSADLDAIKTAPAEPIHDDSSPDTSNQFQSIPPDSSPDSFFNSNNTFNGKKNISNERMVSQSQQDQVITEPFHEVILDDRKTKRSVTVAMGSCLQQRFKRLKAFGAMSVAKPDIIVLTGDNVYLDMIPYQFGCAKCLNNDIVDGEQCFPWYECVSFFCVEMCVISKSALFTI